MAVRIRLTSENTVKTGLAIAVSVMVLYPVAVLVLGSVVIEGPAGEAQYSAANYLDILADRRIREAFVTTIIFATGSTLIAALFGIPLAWITTRTDAPLQRQLDMLYLVPFFISSYQGAVAWKFLASPKIGLLNSTAMTLFGLDAPPLNIHSVTGMLFVEGLFLAPIVFLFAKSTLTSMDPRLEESSRVAGFGVWQTALRITVPLSTPSIVSALLLVFVTAAGSLAVPLFLGVPFRIKTLSTQVFEVLAFQPDYGKASAISLLLVFVTLIGWVVQRRLTSRQRFVTVTGKSHQPRTLGLGRWRYAALAFCLLYLALALVLPIATLLVVSLSRVWTGSFDPALFTLANYGTVLTSELVRRAMVNTVVIATVGATVSVVLAVPLAHTIYRSRLWLRHVLDFVVTMPIAFGGVVIAVGVLLTYIRTPLYGTIWLITIGLLTRFSVFALKPVASVLVAIDPELEEGSRVCGASFFVTLRRVLCPLLKPGIVSGWLILFIIFMREFDITSLLYSHQSIVVSVAIFVFSEREPSPTVAALALIQVIVILVGTYVFMRFTGGRGIAF